MADKLARRRTLTVSVPLSCKHISTSLCFRGITYLSQKKMLVLNLTINSLPDNPEYKKNVKWFQSTNSFKQNLVIVSKHTAWMDKKTKTFLDSLSSYAKKNIENHFPILAIEQFLTWSYRFKIIVHFCCQFLS